ncbi:MAG: TetR/AcrR family transcriptional regulator [FCB group bacterium]|nr:TetR/AcrR family transcriptional regulator [FCB group bacterium]
MENSKQELRKEQILDAALRVIVRKGYDNSRMDDIVETSGLSKGAIYWYYKSKKEIYLSLVNYWVSRYSTPLNHIVENDKSASGQLQDLFQFFITQYEQDPNLFKAMVEFWALSGRDQDFHDKVQKVYSEFLELIKQIIEKGKQSGEFKNVDVLTTALSIMVNIEGIIWFTLFNGLGIGARTYIETITDFILSGLVKKT